MVLNTKVAHGKAQVGLREYGKRQLLRRLQLQGRLLKATTPELTHRRQNVNEDAHNIAPNSLGRLEGVASCTKQAENFVMYFIINGKPSISLGGLKEKNPNQTYFRVGNTGMSQGFEVLEQVVKRGRPL